MAALNASPDAAARPARAVPPRAPRRTLWWSWMWIALGALYFLLPLLGTLIFSLKAQRGVLSLLAYQQVLADPQFYHTFLFSLEMAVLTIVVSLVLVVPTAYWIRLKLPRLRILVEFVSLMPFVIPAIVLVFGLIRVFSGRPFHLTDTLAGTDALLVAAYVVLALPYMFRAVDVGLQAIDVRSLTEAAQSLGAGWGTILLQIIFPNLRVALVSGAFLTLATVMGEFTIASFIVGINAFGPYMSQIGQNKAYQSASLAIISFLLTWFSMIIIQFFSRGRTEKSSIAAAH
ncbi:MAG TPA: ABC transporter permease subunit [Anaerolineaceae bacterium]